LLRVQEQRPGPQVRRPIRLFGGDPVIAWKLPESAPSQLNALQRPCIKCWNCSWLQVHLCYGHRGQLAQKDFCERRIGRRWTIEHAEHPMGVIEALRLTSTKIPPVMNLLVDPEQVTTNGDQGQFAGCQVCGRRRQPGIKSHASDRSAPLKAPSRLHQTRASGWPFYSRNPHLDWERRPKPKKPIPYPGLLTPRQSRPEQRHP